MTMYLGNYNAHKPVISNGTTVSSRADLVGSVLTQIQIPAAFTGTAITFQSSHDDTTYQPLYNDSNTQLSITVAAGRNYNIAPTDFAGCRYLKVVSNASEGADRTVVLICRECQ